MPKTNPSGKPKGRVSAYAYFIQACREDLKKRYPDETVPFGEFSRACAQKWLAMSAQERAPFHNRAETDKQRYDNEMRTYVPPDASKDKPGDKKNKKKRDTNLPKLPMTPSRLFGQAHRSHVRMLHPTYNSDDISKELGRMWAEADPETRVRYSHLAEQDRERYKKELEAFVPNTSASAGASYSAHTSNETL